MAISKIGSKALVDCSVAATDIADGSITAAKLAGSIANAKLANSSITVNGTSVSLGASGTIPAVSWQSVKTNSDSPVTLVAGNGYFMDTTSGAITATLPGSPSAGDTIAIKDYAATFNTNNLTIGRNGNNIQGVANDSLITTNRASVTLVYVDATKGWLYTVESNVAELVPTFISATGGTITTDGDYKVHAFTGDGCFVVSQLGNSGCVTGGGPSNVQYLVVAGGGGSGMALGGGGGAGGYRISPACGTPVSITTYPITVGAGGAGQNSPSGYGTRGTSGSNSSALSITSAGGGASGGTCAPGTPSIGALSGGSGGGGNGDVGVAPNRGGAAGNTPPVSPPQGNSGGTGGGASAAGGGGAGGVGANGSPSFGQEGGDGGVGSDASPIFGAAPKAFYPSIPAPRGPSSYFAGGGKGGSDQPAASGSHTFARAKAAGAPNTAAESGYENTGGGGGGSSGGPGGGVGLAGAGSGGKGIVLIRYKFQ